MTAGDASPALRSMDPHDQFDALVGWLHSDEAMGLPFAEVEGAWATSSRPCWNDSWASTERGGSGPQQRPRRRVNGGEAASGRYSTGGDSGGASRSRTIAVGWQSLELCSEDRPVTTYAEFATGPIVRA